MYSANSGKNIPALVYTLIRDHSVAVPDVDWYASYEYEFYLTFEDMMGNFELPAVPLVFDPGQKKFTIMNKFHENCRYSEFEYFKAVFYRRFDAFYRRNSQDDEYRMEDEDGDMEPLYEENGEDPVFDLRYPAPFKTFDDKYVARLIAEKFEIADADTEYSMDSYGWIHNRKSDVYNELITLAGRFCLPRFPVTFHENARGFDLHAGRGELNTYRYLLMERRAKYMDLNTRIEDKTPGDFRQQMAEKFGALALLQKSWDHENRNYDFPSRIGFYATEIASEAGLDFQHHRDRLAKRRDMGGLGSFGPK